jgi:hypothetical protein
MSTSASGFGKHILGIAKNLKLNAHIHIDIPKIW